MKIMIMLMALLLVGSVAATLDNDEFTVRDFDDLNIIGAEPIQWFPFMEPRFFIYVGVEQTCNEIPDLLDQVNSIINNIYWQQYWLNYQPEDDYVGGGSSPVPVQEELEEELSPGLTTALKLQAVTDCYNKPAIPNCEDGDLNSDDVVDVFDLAIVGNQA